MMDGKKKVVIAPALYTWYRARYLIVNGVKNVMFHNGVKLAASVAHLVPEAAHIKRILGETYWGSACEALDRFERDDDPRSIVYAVLFHNALYNEFRLNVVKGAALAGDPFAQAVFASGYAYTDDGEKRLMIKMAELSAQQMDPDGIMACFKQRPMRDDYYIITAARLGHPLAQRLHADECIRHGAEYFLWLGRAAEIEQGWIEFDSAARRFSRAVIIHWHAMSRKTKYQIGSSVKGFLESNAQGATAYVFGTPISGKEYKRIKQCVDWREKCILMTKSATKALCRVAFVRGRLNRDARNLVCQMIWDSRSEAVYHLGRGV